MASFSTLSLRLSASVLFIYVFYSVFTLLGAHNPASGVLQVNTYGIGDLFPFSSPFREDRGHFDLNPRPPRPARPAPKPCLADDATTVGNAVAVPPHKWTVKEYSDQTLGVPVKHRVFTNINYHTSPSLLVLVMTRDSSSWARGRNFASFLYMLEWLELDPATISLTLLTSSEEEFETYSHQGLKTDYASLHLIHHPGYSDIGSSRLFRHFGSFQHTRRVEMARLRNYASLTSLELGHEHLLWIDADVYEISPGLVQRMLGFSSAHPQVGILTAISHYGEENDDYDFNSWVGARTTPNEAQRARLRLNKGSWSPNAVPGQTKHMGDLRDEAVAARRREQPRNEARDNDDDDNNNNNNNNNDDDVRSAEAERKEAGEEEAVMMGANETNITDWTADSPDHIDGLFRLDSVGATLLLMKSHLWRQGLSFATSYLVGTDFQDEGWDGVESEGLCVAARNLINEEYGRQGGVGCWGVVDGYTRHSAG